MRAIYFSEFNGEISVQDVPQPQAPKNGVVIKVEATGLCRSDWHGWAGHDSDIALPHVPGHELAGTVFEAGEEVARFHVGDRITVPFVNGCGKCTFCTSGNAQVCPNQTQPGFTQWGSFAEYVALENADFNLISLPDEISFQTAAALGCRFATAFRGIVDRAQIKPGEWVAIFGCGGVGLSSVMIAKAMGAKVIAVDINPDALLKAGELGADYSINSTKENPVKTIRDITELGAHVSIDALGSEATANSAVLSLRRMGRHVQLGLLLTESGQTPMPMSRVIGWELDILGSHGMAAVDYQKMLGMVASGELKPQDLISREVSLDVGAEELGKMENSKTSGITIINPTKI
jgi:alcohol dehydrogenase